MRHAAAFISMRHAAAFSYVIAQQRTRQSHRLAPVPGRHVEPDGRGPDQALERMRGIGHDIPQLPSGSPMVPLSTAITASGPTDGFTKARRSAGSPWKAVGTHSITPSFANRWDQRR